MRDLNKLILRAWLMIFVGVVFTTETFVCLLDVLFRRRPIHCITKAKSSILFYRATERVVRTVEDFVKVCCADEHSTREQCEENKE